MMGEQATLLERMQLLQEQGVALQEQLRASRREVEREISAYVGTEAVQVTVSLTETGFPAELEIHGPAKDRSAAEYTAAVNTAFLVTQATGAALPIEASRAIIAAVTSGEEPPSLTISDDFGQLAVTASFGSVRSVHLEDQWVRSCSDRVLAEEILRVAQQAAKASDTFHRFE
ncbi:hypothetical protein M4D51_08375 [Microbacterium sp. p3-SID338]|uniref:hypothetical protein n=2 Tax=Microbacterium TaxID=33882 RepID=UPI00078684A9|nr:hypothetical protein [Microbacterium sp. p3-SID338]KYJ96820.1 hypothetical protein AUV07_03410 [Microbacterium sp. CH1]MCT1395741.1 hypothetical protein [Microbacterium sp. p3-SID338]PMC04956.1 hypothetical protein CJ226_04940 [Microbacterium sp. UMB0228]